MEETLKEVPYFADAESSLSAASFVVMGVPYDRTCCHRKGARRGPASIRYESWNFESFLFEYGVDIADIPICDLGDVDIAADLAVSGMGAAVRTAVEPLVAKSKIPVLLGGEHSLSAFAVAAFSAAQRERLGIVSIDAHLDYRDGFRGEAYSHACSTRRLSELVGADHIVPIGIRSMSRTEYEDAEANGLRYFPASAVRSRGIETVLDEVEALLAADCDHYYLTIDIDGLDPAYAPAVGTPEPFGLTPREVNAVIEHFAPQSIGFDIVEVAPPEGRIGDNTAALAARLARTFIALCGGGEGGRE